MDPTRVLQGRLTYPLAEDFSRRALISQTLFNMEMRSVHFQRNINIPVKIQGMPVY